MLVTRLAILALVVSFMFVPGCAITLEDNGTMTFKQTMGFEIGHTTSTTNAKSTSGIESQPFVDWLLKPAAKLEEGEEIDTTKDEVALPADDPVPNTNGLPSTITEGKDPRRFDADWFGQYPREDEPDGIAQHPIGSNHRC